MTYSSSSSRKRRRSVAGESKPILPERNWEEEEEDSYSQEKIKSSSRAGLKEEEILITAKGLNEIKAELREERSSGLLESDYWDETHSWGSDSEVESDEYWHFVGRYE